MQKLVEATLVVVRESYAVGKAATTIQGKRWLERGPASDFQAQAASTACSSIGHNL